MKLLAIVVVLLSVTCLSDAALRAGATNLLNDWLGRIYNTPINWVNTTDPCSWTGFTCTSNATQDVTYIILDGTSTLRAFALTGDLPPLPTWQASGFFPSLKGIMIRGPRFGPYVPSWLLNYWYVGWATTDAASFKAALASTAFTFRLWLPYWLRQNDTLNHYEYFCDQCGTSVTGLGCIGDPGCVSGFICPLPFNQTTLQSTESGLYCTNLNMVSRNPTHGPITGGTSVTLVINVPAQYYGMQCLFDDIPVTPTNFTRVEYFPQQDMMMQFNCVSPPHAAGTVQINLIWNGTIITDFSVPFDYSCPPGTEEPAVATDNCVSCQLGYFQPTHGSCSKCPANSYADIIGATNCTMCPAGTVSTTIGATSSAVCIPCGTGYYWSDYQCLPCPSGSFTDKTGQLSCTVCPLGQFSLPIPGVRCALCAAGTYGVADPITGAPSCVNCPAGSFTPTSGMTACIDCAAGRYQPLDGQTSCENVCPAGTYSAKSNTTQPWDSGQSDITPVAPSSLTDPTTAACLSCPPGYYSDRNASIVCKPCPLGYYTTLSRATECQKCPSGQTTAARGSTGCIDIPKVQTSGETTGLALAIILAIVALILVVGTLSYVIYKRKQQAKLRKQIEEMQESAALQ